MDCAGRASGGIELSKMRIACVHQGYELYGSDRCFVESVAALREAYPQAEIEVVLPRDGPISQTLAPLANRNWCMVNTAVSLAASGRT